MSCYHPLRGVVTGLNENGKKRISILKSNDIEKNISGLDGIEYITLPCGQCIGCRLDRSRSWADRCMLEASYHEKNSFITLTYDDEHLPEPRPIIDTDGVIIGFSPFHPLVKKDFQDFMKRLRYYLNDNKIRYFACGEYGSTTFRPHYHCIIFGYDFSEDRTFYKFNFDRSPLYNSDILSRSWRNGFSVVGNCTWNSCAYVARYCLKKSYGKDSDIYSKLNYEPEFTLMSRNPGIAFNYYEDHKNDIYKNDEFFLTLPDRSLKLRPSRYYDKLYDFDNPSDMDRIRDLRKSRAETRQILELEKTSLHYLDYLKVKEDNKENSIKILKERSGII